MVLHTLQRTAPVLQLIHLTRERCDLASVLVYLIVMLFQQLFHPVRVHVRVRVDTEYVCVRVGARARI